MTTTPLKPKDTMPLPVFNAGLAREILEGVASARTYRIAFRRGDRRRTWHVQNLTTAKLLKIDSSIPQADTHLAGRMLTESGWRLMLCLNNERVWQAVQDNIDVILSPQHLRDFVDGYCSRSIEAAVAKATKINGDSQ